MGTKIDLFGTTKLTLAAHAQFNELVAGQLAASDLEALHLTLLPPTITLDGARATTRTGGETAAAI